MIDEFAACIREEREPKVSGRDGLAAVRVVQAAYESAASGKPRATEPIKTGLSIKRN